MKGKPVVVIARNEASPGARAWRWHIETDAHTIASGQEAWMYPWTALAEGMEAMENLLRHLTDGMGLSWTCDRAGNSHAIYVLEQENEDGNN